MKRIGLIALDMDGTLLLSDHRTVPERNIRAIRRANAQGIRVCICTGRMLEDASDFIRRLDLPCMLIGCNGTRAADGPLPEGPVFYRCNFRPEDVHAAIDVLLPYGLTVNGLEDGLVSTVRGTHGDTYHLVRRGLVRGVEGADALRAAADRGLMKLFVTGNEEDREKLRQARWQLKQALPHLQVTSSGPLNIEIMPPGTGKGEALARMAAHLQLPREAVMAVGDEQNDLSMLTYAFHSVAMGNASQEIQRICRYVTAENDACGVAQIIERVLSSREG